MAWLVWDLSSGGLAGFALAALGLEDVAGEFSSKLARTIKVLRQPKAFVAYVSIVGTPIRVVDT